MLDFASGLMLVTALSTLCLFLVWVSAKNLASEFATATSAICVTTSTAQTGKTMVRLVKGLIPMRSPTDVYRHIGPELGRCAMEHLVLLLINKNGELVMEVRCTDEVPGFVRLPSAETIASYCRRQSVDTIIFAHNHPNGTPYPSLEDIHYTNMLARNLRELGITLKDHVIVAKEHFCSIREHNFCEALCATGNSMTG